MSTTLVIGKEFLLFLSSFLKAKFPHCEKQKSHVLDLYQFPRWEHVKKVTSFSYNFWMWVVVCSEFHCFRPYIYLFVLYNRNTCFDRFILETSDFTHIRSDFLVFCVDFVSSSRKENKRSLSTFNFTLSYCKTMNVFVKFWFVWYYVFRSRLPYVTNLSMFIFLILFNFCLKNCF